MVEREEKGERKEERGGNVMYLSQGIKVLAHAVVGTEGAHDLQ